MRSARRSGTMQAACGRTLQAIATISAVAAISRLSGFVMTRLEPRDVVIDDVAAIFAQMRGDAVGAGSDRDLGGLHRIGMLAAARIAHGGDVIDVDAEAERSGSRHADLRQRLAVHALGVGDHLFRPQLRNDRSQVLEVVDFKIDGQLR